jgi:hypothetical protein
VSFNYIFKDIPNYRLFFVYYFLADFTVFTIPLSINLRITKGLYNSAAISDTTFTSISIQVQQQLPNEQNNPHVFQVSFDGNVLALPLRESDNDFNGLFDSVFTADALCIVKNESTDS